MLLVLMAVSVRWLESDASRGRVRTGSPGSAAANVDRCEIDGRFLRAFDCDGRELWTLDLKQELARGAYGPSSQRFEALHQRARREGLVDHDLGVADERFLEPVLRWDGTRFVPLDTMPLVR